MALCLRGGELALPFEAVVPFAGPARCEKRDIGRFGCRYDNSLRSIPYISRPCLSSDTMAVEGDLEIPFLSRSRINGVVVIVLQMLFVIFGVREGPQPFGRQGILRIPCL